MKTIIIFLLCTIIALSQTREPAQHQFTYHNGTNTVTEYLSGSTPYFQLNDFMLGWNWGSPGRKLDEALMINSYHGLDFDTLPNEHASELKVLQYLQVSGTHLPCFRTKGCHLMQQIITFPILKNIFSLISRKK